MKMNFKKSIRNGMYKHKILDTHSICFEKMKIKYTLFNFLGYKKRNGFDKKEVTHIIHNILNNMYQVHK